MLKRQDLEAFSFDYSAHKSPLAYQTFHQSVELLHRTKLIPASKSNYGAVFLKKASQDENQLLQLETHNYEIDVEFVINSELEKSNGFAIMLLKNEPEIAGGHSFFGEMNGVRRDFNGIGVFLYRSVTRQPGQWVIKILHP